MKVSVIIPTYNHSKTLEYTLSSLVEQDFPNREYEVIVIDDGSSDNTKAVVNSFKSKLNIIYYFQEHKKFSATLAKNEGIKRANGDVLVFIDTGIVVGNTFIRAHYNAHNDDSNERYVVIGYVYGFGYDYKENDTTPEFIDFSRPNQMLQKLKRTNYYSDIRELVYAKIHDDLNSITVPWMLFSTNNVSVRRTELVGVGCFNEDFVRLGVEDVECAYRLHNNKLKFKLSREACGVHYPHEQNEHGDNINGESNLRLFYNKHQDDVLELFSTCDASNFIYDYIDFLACKQ